MSPDAYKQALKQARSQLAGALHQRDRWTMEIARLQQLVKSLAANCGKGDRSAARASQEADIIGIQELVFTCIRLSPGVVAAGDVKSQLEAIGYDVGRFANPLAIIHGALKRLEKAGKIERIGMGYRRSQFHEFIAQEGFAPDDGLPVE